MSPASLTPLPYQRRILDYLKSEEPDLFAWLASTEARGKHAEKVRLEILKETYRLDRAAHADLYVRAESARDALELSAPVTVYQAPGTGQMNASLIYLPGEAHVVLNGPVLAALTPDEQRAMFAHELSHFALYEGHGGEYFTAQEALLAMANDSAAAPAHVASARLMSLYGELHADRGAFAVAGDVAPPVGALVKILTGLTEASAESYLKQADEIFSKEKPTSDGLTHPEPFIRARALKLWAESGDAADDEIARMIEGSPSLDALDLTAQRRLTDLTRRTIGQLIAPAWFRSDPVLAHARPFFDDSPPPAGGVDDPALPDAFKGLDPSVRDYFCYVLLDFAAVDPDLEDQPLAAAAALARRLDLGDRFVEIAGKELGLAKKTLAKLRKP